MTPTELAQYRRDTYAEYRAWGEDPGCAALRVHVSPRTARRYEAALRQAQLPTTQQDTGRRAA